MEVKKGYKKTEVGIIPEDWGVIQLREVSSVKTGPFGSSLHESDYVNNGIPIITVEHLSEFGITTQNLPLVSQNDYKRLLAYQLISGDIVFSRVGSVDRSSIISDYESGWLFSGRLLRIRILKHIITSKYLIYHFQQEAFKQRVRRVAVGQTMPSLNTQILNHLEVAYPPTLTEQRAIATALSDVDRLLSACDQLIAKKKAIKQGAMQELLTGRRRLEGFRGEWEVKKLGDHIRFQVGFPFLSSYFNKSNHGLRLVKNRDLKSNDQVVYYSGEYPNDFLVENGDVLIGMDGDFVPCLWRNGKALLNQRVGRIKRIAGFDLGFGYYYLQKPLKDIENATSSTTVKHLSHGDIENIELPLPEECEQHAIAQILTDLDAEIAALEQQRDKYKAVKAGMMQELLTGKTRLI